MSHVQEFRLTFSPSVCLIVAGSSNGIVAIGRHIDWVGNA